MTSVKHTLVEGLPPGDLRVLAYARDRAPTIEFYAVALARLDRRQLVTGGGTGDGRPAVTCAGLFALAPAAKLYALRTYLAAAEQLARCTARAHDLPRGVVLARILNGQRYCAACIDWHRAALVAGGLCAEARARRAAPLRQEAF